MVEENKGNPAPMRGFVIEGHLVVAAKQFIVAVALAPTSRDFRRNMASNGAKLVRMLHAAMLASPLVELQNAPSVMAEPGPVDMTPIDTTGRMVSGAPMGKAELIEREKAANPFREVPLNVPESEQSHETITASLEPGKAAASCAGEVAPESAAEIAARTEAASEAARVVDVHIEAVKEMSA